MAHPLGANFNEILIKLAYRPINKLYVEVNFWSATKGMDDGRNWGGNILKPNRTRVMDFENETTQGITTDFTLTNVSLSYELAHRIYFDLDFAKRIQSGDPSFFWTTGLRMNIGKQNRLF